VFLFCYSFLRCFCLEFFTQRLLSTELLTLIRQRQVKLARKVSKRPFFSRCRCSPSAEGKKEKNLRIASVYDASHSCTADGLAESAKQQQQQQQQQKRSLQCRSSPLKNFLPLAVGEAHTPQRRLHCVTFSDFERKRNSTPVAKTSGDNQTVAWHFDIRGPPRDA
jgi:hypothetical protein